MWTDSLINRLIGFIDKPNHKIEFRGFNIPQDVVDVSLEHRTFEVVDLYGSRIYDLDKHKPSDFKILCLVEVEEWYED